MPDPAILSPAGTRGPQSCSNDGGFCLDRLKPWRHLRKKSDQIEYIGSTGNGGSNRLNQNMPQNDTPIELPEPAVAYSRSEIRAEEVARSLSKFFYEQGCFTALSSFYPGYEPPMLPAARDPDFRFIRPQPEFGGLSVQAVGFELGKVADPSVHVYLTKMNRSVEKSLPKEVDGVPVKLSRMGRLTVCPGPLGGSHYFEHSGRPCCGSSSAPSSERYAGTLGCLIRIGEDASSIYALSNNHVFAAGNHIPVGQPIMSPANIDSGPSQAPRHIANHSRIIELRSGVVELVEVNRSDIAIAKLATEDAVSSWQGDQLRGYDTPSRSLPPVSGMLVKKFGRSSGYTTGTVEALSVSYLPLPYKCTHFKALAWFENVWTVRGIGGPFAIPGDSGSLVINELGDAAIGVVFAAGGDIGWIVPMTTVQKFFGGVQLVGGHHV